ncbi:hypothetical protein BOX15_Mlig015343g1 [Macrostomum lignano]|uniref:EF-hand domain-containing protein n=2 Tax=Macrostomum lignano TaxID=282301 RepID=A0A1I8GCD0_9PLAT|nr:hypothetical protein BOX15_Mlig015343g3 [Macrostomum lignano]PAA57802.1 hypothetical protein BOX15_Mlig015343g2 [Macrostomum lignano]PAA87243.1 hypothetical protein BOX15_Mlig015343g1 [Macrostomum lignano]
MEAFKEAWLAIDRQGRGQVTIDDLVVYARKMNYDENFVSKWQKLFDPNKTGVIELGVFCDVLGLNAKEIQEQSRANAAAGLPSDVIYISGDMSLEWQIKVVEVTKQALRDSQKMSDVPKRIKTTLDRMYSQLWHVVIAQGQFWCYYGHEPGYSFVFQIGKQVFIIFKTPCS